MPDDKDAAKRRRQARNRQERMQRQKRIEGAKRSGTRPTPSSGGTTADAPASSAPSGGFLGRLFPPRSQPAPEGRDGRPSRAQPVPVAEGTDGRPSRSQPARSGRPARPTESVVVAADAGSGLRGFIDRAKVQPGGRPTLLALLASLASAIALLFFPVIPQIVLQGYGWMVVDASPVGEQALEARLERFDEADPIVHTVRLLETPNPFVIVLFALVPVAICVIAVRSLTSPTRSRTLLISAIIGALYTFLTGAVGVYFFLGVICLGWASFQSRKADAMVAAAEG